ncbi:MAG: RNA polymerase sigma factor [Planctomycetota bacterium]|jgi:RNA polymerase sigma factor (sigma-70 family)
MSDLPELLVQFRADLLRFVERHAGSLLRFETTEDLLQGIHLRALEHKGGFQFQGRERFLAWLYKVARNYLGARRVHWNALKRKPAGLFRLTQSVSSDPGAIVAPAATATGPSTFADRREQLTIAVKALAVLMPRDQQLVQWSTDGVENAEMAERLGISREAAERARLRALERFRKAHQLLSRKR